MTLTPTSETSLASWTFAAAHGNTRWHSSKIIYFVFELFHLARMYFCCFKARALRWTSSNFRSCPLFSIFLFNPDDVHLSITWSQSCSVSWLPKLLFSAWCVNLITNWSTISLFSCLIWEKMCLIWEKMSLLSARNVRLTSLKLPRTHLSRLYSVRSVSNISCTSVPAQWRSKAFFYLTIVSPMLSTNNWKDFHLFHLGDTLVISPLQSNSWTLPISTFAAIII